METDLATFKENIVPMLHRAMASAKYAHDAAFGDDRAMDDLLAGILLNDATIQINTAYAYYLQNPDFQRNEFEDFFNKYNIFRGEILTNIRTKHSHQWTDIEYLEFARHAQHLADLLGMNADHFYKDL